MALDLHAKVELRFVILTKAKSPKVEARSVQMVRPLLNTSAASMVVRGQQSIKLLR